MVSIIARSVAPGELKPGQRVRVTGMLGPTSFIVEDANAATSEAAESDS